MTKQKNNNLAYKDDIDRSNINNRSRITDFDNHVKKQERFCYSRLHWKQIPRANNPNKSLQDKAVSLLSVIVFKLRRQKVVVLNHNYLSRITNCGKDQNVNLLKQLSDMLDVSFHAKISISGKICRNSYVIKHTEKGHAIIENAEILLAQKHFVGKMAVAPIEKPATEEEKDDTSTEFFPPSYLYKEKVFENNRSNESIFLENSNSSIKSKTSNFIEIKNANLAEDGSHKATIHILKPNKNPQSIKTTNQRKKATKADNKAKKAKLLRFNQYNKSKDLSDHYPLTTEDCSLLQSKSGRDFSTNVINEILLALSKKPKQREYKFPSKASFIAYMSKAFRYEMRDAVKINNETFKIKANYSEEENNIHKQEKFLSEIESSLQVNPEWHLKKKLASVLERRKAYNLLSNYKTIERVGDTFKFYLSNKIEIGEMDKQIILNQVRATHERVGEEGDIEYIDKVEFIIDKRPFVVKEKIHKENSELPKTIWGEIRHELISIHGSDIDAAWFKDIESQENKARKTIKLKVESSFKQSWIKENYLILIEQIAKSKNYEIEIIEC